MVLASGNLSYFIHIFLDNGWSSLIVFIHRFSALKINIWIFCPNFHHGFFWIESSLPESFQILRFKKLGQRFIGYKFYLLNLAGCAEAVEEMEERYPAFQAG